MLRSYFRRVRFLVLNAICNMEAFCRTAPTVRRSVFAITRAGVFCLASFLSVAISDLSHGFLLAI